MPFDGGIIRLEDERFRRCYHAMRVVSHNMVTATSTALKALVRRLIDDPTTSTAIRNECHLLLIAIDGNNREQIDERLEHLTKLLDASNIKTSD